MLNKMKKKIWQAELPEEVCNMEALGYPLQLSQWSSRVYWVYKMLGEELIIWFECLQLEDGEIDVRLNSFKGCLSQDKSNKHKELLPGESNPPDLGIGWDNMGHPKRSVWLYDIRRGGSVFVSQVSVYVSKFDIGWLCDKPLLVW